MYTETVRHEHVNKNAISLILIFVITFFVLCTILIFNKNEQPQNNAEAQVLSIQEDILNTEPETALLPAPVFKMPQKDIGVKRTSNEFMTNLHSDEKVVFLTFDDGPSYNVTPAVLDTLKQYDIKATFFVLGSAVDKHPDLLVRMYEEGHTIANHTHSHVYKTLYSTPDNLIDDIALAQKSINEALGFEYNNRLFRFPGGSYDKKDVFSGAVYDSGFQYVDWNCVGNDAVSKKTASPQQILQSIIDTSIGKNPIIALLHDSSVKTTTAEALPLIIEHFTDLGYTFKALAE